MIEAIVSGLVIAAVSGLTFLAYKHHAGYRVIIVPLFYVVIGIYLVSAGYTFGFSDGKYHGDKPMPFSFGWVSVGAVAFLIFSKILDFLPELTNQDRKDDADKNKPPKDDAA